MDSATAQPNNVSGKKNQIKKTQKRLLMLVAASVIALAVIIFSGWFLYRSSTAATIDSSKYQAVFFTNGQVYFGKLNQVNANYFKLKDVFYIQPTDAEDTATESENPQETSTQSTDIRLIKLGSEVHGPEDAMIISKDQVLFFENLKPEGKVSDSIVKFNKQRTEQ